MTLAQLISANLAFAFSAGMASAVNPCGFALLPAYLTYFLGLESKDGSEKHEISNPFLRAALVSAAMTAGFVVVFGLVGIIWSSVSSLVGDSLPWVTVVLGVAIFVAGIAMVFGFQPVFSIPKLQMKAQSQELSSMFLFGVSYAVASLSCTLPIFLAVVSTSFRTESFSSGVSSFVMYALGMGSLVAVLTIAVSFAREGIVRRLRGMLPYMGRISGVLMIIAGLFVVYYGWWETQVLAGNEVSDGLAGVATDWQADVQNWISSTGEVAIGVAAALIVAAAIGIGMVMRRGQSTKPTAG